MIEDEVSRARAYVDNAARNGETRLPPEPKLGEALGVSRGRLRTILQRLEDEGLIWRHVGKGTFVGARCISADDQASSASISVDDIMDARLLLEPQLAAQAAIHATPADIAAMERALSDMTGAVSFLQWKRLDDKLHRTIAEAAHNVLLLILFDTLRSQMRARLDARMEEVFGALHGPKESTDAEHRAFVESIRAHNPERAEQSMRAHLHSVRIHLFGLR